MSATKQLVDAIKLGDCISRSALLEKTVMVDTPRYGHLYGRSMVDAVEVENAPALDVVLLGTYEQCRWERDVAMQQLVEHGIPFACSSDVVARRPQWVSIHERVPDYQSENNNCKITDVVIAVADGFPYVGYFTIYKYDNTLEFIGTPFDNIFSEPEFVNVSHWLEFELPDTPGN